MGKRSAAGKTLALQYDADGKLRHDAIARVGHEKNKVGIIASCFTSCVFLLDCALSSGGHEAEVH